MIASQRMSIELGGVIFLFIGGLIATLGWQWPFLLYLFAWVLLAMQLAFVPQPLTPRTESMNESTGESESVGATQLAPVLFAALLSMTPALSSFRRYLAVWLLAFHGYILRPVFFIIRGIHPGRFISCLPGGRDNCSGGNCSSHGDTPETSL